MQSLGVAAANITIQTGKCRNVNKAMSPKVKVKVKGVKAKTKA